MVPIILLFLALAIAGVPFFVLFGGGSLALFLARPEGAWASPAIDVLSQNFAESPFLMIIPLFTFVGFVLAESGTPTRLMELSKAWLGWLPGSLAAVCLVTSTFFATITGGSAATIVAVGGVSYPALLRQGYPERFVVGLITTGGALGALFPPSMLLIFYCILARLPVDQAIAAGLCAGVVSLIALMAYGAYVGGRAGIPRSPFVLREALRMLWVAKWEVAIPIVLLLPVGMGVMRFQESAAVLGLYVVVVEVYLYRDLDLLRDMPRVTVQAVALLGSVMMVLTAAVAFTAWMIQAEVPTLVYDFIEQRISSPYAFLAALNVYLVLIGMFTDGMAAIVVSASLVLPLAQVYGVDPLHLAVVFLLNIELGFIVPPIGMNLFVSSIRFDKSLGYVCRAVLPFIAILALVLLLITYVPALSTALPALVREPSGLSGPGPPPAHGPRSAH